VKPALSASAKRKLDASVGKRALRTKIHLLFREAFGSRAERLLFSDYSGETSQAVRAAYYRRLKKEKADDLAFHIWDWREEAAFAVALNLYPEKFSPEEIREGILIFACHAPYHVNGVAKSLDLEILAPSDEEPKLKKRARKRV
jgi:hypothetical protein